METGRWYCRKVNCLTLVIEITTSIKSGSSIKYCNWKIYHMTQIKCSDYGFECDFVTSGQSNNIAVQFSEHSEHVHGIEYPMQAIDQIIYRKSWTVEFSVLFSFFIDLLHSKKCIHVFAVLFFLEAIIIPIQNLIWWKHGFLIYFYISNEITAEKLSTDMLVLELFM